MEQVYNWQNIDDIRSITWTGERYIAVGGNRTIFISENGITWASALSNVTSELNKVIWVFDKLIASGNGVVLTSDDSLSWDAATPTVHRME